MGTMTEPAAEERLVGADRVLAVLVQLAEHPTGVTLDEMAHSINAPKPTAHRALATLRRAGLAEQVSRGLYVLGDEFFRLAFRNYSQRPEAELIRPALEALVARFGETVHYAVLDGADVVYRAKLDPPAGSIRLTSVVGGRNPAQYTAVGKLLLSHRVHSAEELADALGASTFPGRTPSSFTDTASLWEELQRTRDRGYAIDDQENELGVNCIAVPVQLDPALPPTGAVSVSALAFRLPLAELIEHAVEIRAIVDRPPRTAD